MYNFECVILADLTKLTLHSLTVNLSSNCCTLWRTVSIDRIILQENFSETTDCP